MTAQEIIRRKQSGKELSKDELTYIISDKVPDYQLSAFLMAVYFQGMTYEETYHLTLAMLESGVRLDISSIDAFKADKHSTGGVGDKVSIILAPLLASAGIIVPMISGRGLGHSGGTLDKLESIPGFTTNLSLDECGEQLSKTGAILIGQTADLAPADRRVYALRDSTSTVRSIPLITASILSKKLAEDIDALVMDIKIGKGAFFSNQKYGLKLADSLIDTGARFGLKVSCLFTAMDQPLGNAVGNWLEIVESIEVLKGRGPKDLIEVVLALCSEVLVQSKTEKSLAEANKRLEDLLSSGRAYSSFIKIVSDQGGDIRFIEDTSLYPDSKRSYEVVSERNGFVSAIDGRQIGELSMHLGAGRATMSSEIDHKAGIVLHKKNGDKVKRGQVIAVVYTDADIADKDIQERLLKAVQISESQPEQDSLILAYATSGGVYKWPY
ncbi:MAG: thymidine phosphorylase [candidate division KSB1 bacterium]|jgi:pyrimidine-nucleoside phosphorylase|nr:thymidine phosphorylase [candidate division KSB1 bacterium]